MKQLSDFDLAKMVGAEFTPDDNAVNKQVRRQLNLSTLIPEPIAPAPKNVILDLHNNTEEQAWERINALLESESRSAQIITGASGILKTKFIDWITNGILANKISEWKALNNGSFEIRIKKKKSIN